MSTNPEKEIPSKKKSDSSPYSPRTCGQGYFQYGLILSILFISSIFFILGNDTTFSKFFFTFLKFDQFNISTGAASWAVISYWLSYSVILPSQHPSIIHLCFFSIGRSFNCRYCLNLCSREHLSECRLVCRFMSRYRLVSLCLGDWSISRKFIRFGYDHWFSIRPIYSINHGFL